MLKRLGLVLLVTLVFSNLAQAIFVDPYAGYGFGSETNDSATDKSESVWTEYGAGARIGMDFAMFFAGANVSYMMGSREVVVNAAGTTITNPTATDYTHLTAGLIAGVSVPVLPLRFWVGYDFLNTMTISDVDSGVLGEVDVKLSGYMMRVGAGFKVIPLLQIWAEYQMSTMTETEVLGITVEEDDPEAESTIMVGLSIPLSI